MFVVDTNVLVYAADRSAPEHERCRKLVERWRHQGGAWYITWGICYEFVRVVTHPRVLRKPWTLPDAHNFLVAVLASAGLEVLTATDRHTRVLGEVVAELPHLTGNLIHDAHTAVLMREHGIRRICTRDADFSRFPFIEPIDPLTDEP